jgi:SulP family sulfate permease
MISTVVVVVATHDLAKGVFVGVLLSALFFATKVGRLQRTESKLSEDGNSRAYTIAGQVFFASAEQFNAAFDFKEAVEKVSIDVSAAHFWDITAVGALDKVVIKFRRQGTQVDIVGMNEASATIIDKFGTYDKPDALEQSMKH